MLYFLNDSKDPYYNQAFEEYIFNNYTEDDILLIWQNRPAVVCGCYQNIFSEVNVPLALENNIAIVRRESGGGTVFHDLGNLNYTMIRSSETRSIDYMQFLQPMVDALRSIGIPATTNRTCDITIEGLKISGSAQKIAKNRVLHHGTLLFDTDLKSLQAMAKGQREHFISKGVKSSPWPVTNITNHIADKTMTVDTFKEKLLSALAAPDIKVMTLTEAEQKAIKEIAENKYQTWEWAYGHTPAFTYRRTIILENQQIDLCYESKNGIISSISFAPLNNPLKKAQLVLIGKPLDIPALQRACKELIGYENLYQYLF
jgi:lipoate-protein ligase A